MCCGTGIDPRAVAGAVVAVERWVRETATVVADGDPCVRGDHTHLPVAIRGGVLRRRGGGAGEEEKEEEGEGDEKAGRRDDAF